MVTGRGGGWRRPRKTTGVMMSTTMPVTIAANNKSPANMESEGCPVRFSERTSTNAVSQTSVVTTVSIQPMVNASIARDGSTAAALRRFLVRFETLTESR